MSEMTLWIEQEIAAHDVVVFMKGTALFPQCGFSGRMIQILQLYGIKVHAINVLENDELRKGIKEFSDWPTIPQLYVNGSFVGGCDIVASLHESGELEILLEDAEKGDVSD